MTPSTSKEFSRARKFMASRIMVNQDWYKYRIIKARQLVEKQVTKCESTNK